MRQNLLGSLGYVVGRACGESLAHAALTRIRPAPWYFTPGFLLGLLFRRGLDALQCVPRGSQVSCEKAPELHGFGIKPAADLSADKNKPAAPRVLELSRALGSFDAACARLQRARCDDHALSCRTPAALLAHLLTDSTLVANAAARAPPICPLADTACDSSNEPVRSVPVQGSCGQRRRRVDAAP